MTTNDDIATRLDALEARNQMSELRSKYSWYISRGQGKEISELFTEDAIFELTEANEPTKVTKGRAAIADYFARIQPGLRVPIVTNEIFEISGDTARGTCVMFTPISPSRTRPNGFGGHYVEEFRRVNGVWLFSRRSYYYYWPAVSALMTADPIGNIPA